MAALAAKSGSRGKIHERLNHGRIASWLSNRHTVVGEIAGTRPRSVTSRANSLQLQRDSGVLLVAGSSQASALTATTVEGGKHRGPPGA